MKPITLTLLMTTAMIVPAIADANETGKRGKFTVGLGGGYATSLYDKSEDRGFAFPVLSYETERLSLGFGGISYDVIQNDRFSVSAILTIGESPDFPDKNPLYAGLKRDTSVDLGIGATYSFGGFYLEGAALHDVSSEHDGYSLDAKIGTQFEAGRFAFDVGLGGRYRDDNLSNHLYGVSASEANVSRAAYDVGSTIEPYIDLSVMMPIGDRAALLGNVEYRKVGNDVYNSPLVTRDTAYSVGLGMVYSF